MNDIRYQFRTRSLLDMVNALKSGSLVLSPHFQRKLVWRDLHKVDFIKTILLGYPFPEIFVARGGIDVENMTSVSCVVDGQQRMNAILEFVTDKLEVNGVKFGNFTASEKEAFLKYEIAVIELDLDKDDDQVIEIFKRLNRTFYSLSQIEKLSTEYASSYFMLIAKLMCGDLTTLDEDSGGLLELNTNIDPNLSEQDPNITTSFVKWANSKDIRNIVDLVLNQDIFSSYEISRQVPLMYVLNIACTFMYGIYARNEQVTEHLELYKDDFKEKDSLVDRINLACRHALELDLDNKQFWFSKSNSFTLLVALDARRQEINDNNIKKIKKNLEAFATKVPADYALAAKEAVNNKKERLHRNQYISEIIGESL